MRILLPLGAMLVAFLAIDAAGFDGHYRHAVWSGMRDEGRTAEYALLRYLNGGGWQP